MLVDCGAVPERNRPKKLLVKVSESSLSLTQDEQWKSLAEPLTAGLTKNG